MEGNTLPGVNYPDSLSTGLTSKRTSHKVAEQGRRNRINEALKEMQSLLPKAAAHSRTSSVVSTSATAAAAAATAAADAEDDKDGKGDDGAEGSAKSNSSKAATVESANEYIRALQKENLQVAALRKQLEDVKKQLAQMSTGGGEGQSAEKAVTPAPVKEEGSVSSGGSVSGEVVMNGS